MFPDGGGGGGKVVAFFRHFYLKLKIGTNMALKFLKDKSWVCGEVIVRNLYGVPLNAAFKMFEVFRMKEDVTPLIESDKEKFKKPYTAP